MRQAKWKHYNKKKKERLSVKPKQESNLGGKKHTNGCIRSNFVFPLLPKDMQSRGAVD